MNSITLIMVTASLLAATIVIGAGLSFKTNNAIAQMMGSGMMAGNQSVMAQMMGAGQNITSSINLMNIIGQAIGSKVNVSLSDAATTAEASVGNGSHAVAAHTDDKNGYLVYQITVIDPSMNFSKVIVDPGNGQVLLSKQVSKADMMKDEMERHHKMMSMMMGGSQQDMGIMMGPMNQGMMMSGGRHDMMMGPGIMRQDMIGPHQGRGMMMGPMMGPMTAQAQQTNNITSSNAISMLPTTNATTNATSPAAVVSPSGLNTTTTVSIAQGAQSPSNPEFFVPAEITVKPGQTVTWKNDDSAIHTATSGQGATPDGKFDTGFVPPGQSSKPTAMPTQPGQYPYFCTLHPWMTGTVTVE